MKKIYIPIALLIAILVIITTGAFIVKGSSVNKPANTAPGKGFAVIELFTSEGCSSCPSADETVARLLAKNTDNVYILAYHVDYWDRLGWKDPFSDAAFSQRQSQYASKFGLGSVYTPQVVVNGSSEFVGSDEGKLNNTVNTNLNKQAGEGITINTERSNNSVTVSYEADKSDEMLINFALVQQEATTLVKRGENGGRTLHHVNIVRAFKSIEAKAKGNIVLEIPGGLSNMPLQIISFTQSKKSFKISGAAKKSI